MDHPTIDELYDELIKERNYKVALSEVILWIKKTKDSEDRAKNDPFFVELDTEISRLSEELQSLESKVLKRRLSYPRMIVERESIIRHLEKPIMQPIKRLKKRYPLLNIYPYYVIDPINANTNCDVSLKLQGHLCEKDIVSLINRILALIGNTQEAIRRSIKTMFHGSVGLVISMPTEDADRLIKLFDTGFLEHLDVLSVEAVGDPYLFEEVPASAFVTPPPPRKYWQNFALCCLALLSGFLLLQQWQISELRSRILAPPPPVDLSALFDTINSLSSKITHLDTSKNKTILAQYSDLTEKLKDINLTCPDVACLSPEGFKEYQESFKRFRDSVYVFIRDSTETFANPSADSINLYSLYKEWKIHFDTTISNLGFRPHAETTINKKPARITNIKILSENTRYKKNTYANPDRREFGLAVGEKLFPFDDDLYTFSFIAGKDSLLPIFANLENRFLDSNGFILEGPTIELLSNLIKKRYPGITFTLFYNKGQLISALMIKERLIRYFGYPEGLEIVVQERITNEPQQNITLRVIKNN